jgi:hypothetical protein
VVTVFSALNSASSLSHSALAFCSATSVGAAVSAAAEAG